MDWLSVIGESENSVMKNRIFFRENAAQHWNATAHGYQTTAVDEGRLGGASCVPLEDAQNVLDWRNREVHSYLHNENLPHIQLIPFRDITAPLFNMHAAAAAGGGIDGDDALNYTNTANTTTADCTNFCFFPQLWQIVWKHLLMSPNDVDR